MSLIWSKASILLFVAIISLAAVLITAPSLVSAQADVACQGLDLDASGGLCSDPGSTPGVDGILSTALNLLSLVAGVAAVIMFMIGGTKYITSQGDSNSINSAKNTLLYAAIGLVIVVMAQTAVFFFINETTDNATFTPDCSQGPPC